MYGLNRGKCTQGNMFYYLPHSVLYVTTLVYIVMHQHWDIRQIWAGFYQNIGTVSPALDFGTGYAVVKIGFRIISLTGVCNISGIALGYLIFMTFLMN